MDNVYDIIDDFYDHDENWNILLRREYAEGFIRREAWKGIGVEVLKEEWEQVMMLCLYLGYAETFLGDMTDDDFIDAVGWCGRNISEFKISPASVEFFLKTSAALFVYLKEKKAITGATAPQIAEQRLLGEDKQLRLIDVNGELLYDSSRLALFQAPNAPVKIFLKISVTMQSLLEELHLFFQKKEFNLDLERALFLYHGVLTDDDSSEDTDSEEFWQCFWDYFLFDYHLLSDDLTPLAHFYEHGVTQNKELVTELLKARLALFSVESMTEEGLFVCYDFMTDEEYILNLPLEDDFDTEDKLFVGHCFYNNTLVMNYVRCLKVTKTARARLKKALQSCFAWYQIQEPHGQWEDFLARHPMVIRHLAYLYSAYVKINNFEYRTQIHGYQPLETYPRDEVTHCIEKMMRSYHFSYRDIVLATRLWKDFVSEEPAAVTRPEVWASGVIDNFISLNAVYGYAEEKVAEICWHVPTQALKSAAEKIKRQLHIEKYDPRYCNEEGFLVMMFSS